MKIISGTLAAAAATTVVLSAGPAWASQPPASPAPASPAPATSPSPPASPSAQPPGCAYYPVSAQCLAPLLKSLPPCPIHLWVNTGKGWSCVPAAPSNPPSCRPPRRFPTLVDGTWQCLGGSWPASPRPSAPDVVVAHRT